MPPKRNPLGQRPWRTRSESTFARFSSRHAGLSLAPTGRLHVWESRGPPFTSGCKDSASHVPSETLSPRSRVEVIRGSTLQPIDRVNALVTVTAELRRESRRSHCPCKHLT